MVATRNTQSLTDFRQNATETLERLNKTGEAEIITVNGEAKAVVMSPKAYDEMMRERDLAREQFERDAEAISKSLEDIKAGRVMTLEESSRRIREKLVAMQAARGKVG